MLIEIPLGYENPEGRVYTPVWGYSHLNKQVEHLETLRQIKFPQIRSILIHKLEIAQQENPPLSELDKRYRNYPGLVTSATSWYDHIFPKFEQAVKEVLDINTISPLENCLIVEEDGSTTLFIPHSSKEETVDFGLASWLQIVSSIGSYNGDIPIKPENLKRKAQAFRRGINVTLFNQHLVYPGWVFSGYEPKVIILTDLDKDPQFVNLGLPKFEPITQFKPLPLEEEQRLEERILAT